MKKQRLFLSLLFCGLVSAFSLPALAQTTAAGQTLIEPGRAPGSISIPSFQRLLAEAPASVHLIDVSSAREFAAGSIRGATNIPIHTVEAQMANLPSDKPIIFFCASGSRAGEAYEMTKQARPGLNVHFLIAQVQIRPDGSANIR